MSIVIGKGGIGGRRMSLRYALLALLTGSPLTGYEIAKRFGTSVGHVWHAPDSQIYPELHRMAADDLLRATDEAPRGRRTRKTRYDVTPSGEAALAAWASGGEQPSIPRDPQLLRAAYLEWADPAAARAQFTAYAQFWDEQATTLENTRTSLLDRSHPVLAARLARRPAAEHERIVAYKVHCYDGMIDLARTRARWARDGIALMDRLEAGGTGDAGGASGTGEPAAPGSMRTAPH